ncbi:hypothetical protein HMI54_005652 [Coelomomyces lativittatus]|nr:hypothetical protein HMI54_005652 [Coelomomyces lativittatus]KAJ1515974.1 hypothetical protein HMI56_002309 [Coelomomyces lativittatus]KAJ1517360.1 hypothetical protein HMI55_007315 [Coelomomyces lativittatus]
MFRSAVSRNHNLRPLLFTLGASTCTFGLAVAAYDDRISKLSTKWPFSRFHNPFSSSPSWKPQFSPLQEKIKQGIAETQWLPVSFRSGCIQLVNQWFQLNEGQRWLTTLIGTNLVIFGLWQVPSFRCQSFMNKWFLQSQSRTSTILFSSFSHKSPSHFAFNMFALWTLGNVLFMKMPKEEALSFYISSGLFSGAASHVFTRAPSLGASGCLYGILAALSLSDPDLRISLIFLPMLSIPLKYGFPMILSMDLIGLARGWKVLDHMGHLGGAFFGMMYMTYFREMIWVDFLDWYRRNKKSIKET